MIESQKDLRDLKKAKELLENPGLGIKITNAIGKPLEKGFEKLPDNWNTKIVKVTESAVQYALKTALFTMEDTRGIKPSKNSHKFLAAASGFIGGAGGWVALSAELPISTTIMLRSIADIARSEGESVNNANTQMACVEVFALGGTNSNDDATDSEYFIIRGLLAQSVSHASQFIAEKGLIEEGAPVLVKLITNIANRFSVAVSEKAAAQAIPLIGALGGAAINTVFINHFQDMAQGHFTVRRLERKYGAELVKSTYMGL